MTRWIIVLNLLESLQYFTNENWCANIMIIVTIDSSIMKHGSHIYSNQYTCNKWHYTMVCDIQNMHVFILSDTDENDA